MKTARNAMRASLDVFISFIFIGPFGIAFWRGMWCNMDVYLYPDSPQLSILISFSVGSIVVTILCISMNRLQSVAKSSNNVLVYFLYSRCYTYLRGFAIINKWRGIWLFQDHFTGISSTSALSSCAVAIGILGSFRCLRSVITPPLAVLHDTNKLELCNVKTRFMSKVGVNAKFALDVFVSIWILNNAVVVLWRGVWTLQDVLFKDYDLTTSAFYSLYIACSLAFPVLLGQRLLCRLSRYLGKKSKVLQVIFEMVTISFANLLSISFWRGIWLLQDALLLPSNRELSCWISHITGYLVLTTFLTASSFTSFDCIMDTDIVEEDGALYDITYIDTIMAMLHTSSKTQKSDGRKYQDTCYFERVKLAESK